MKNQPIIFCLDTLDGEDQEEEASRADTSCGWSGIHKDGQMGKIAASLRNRLQPFAIAIGRLEDRRKGIGGLEKKRSEGRKKMDRLTLHNRVYDI